jgi:fatty acid desaturase
MSDTAARREEAVHRIQEKRRFRQSLVVYLAVNALLVVVWAMGGGGYFWPIWPIAGWGLAVAIHAWNVYGARPVTESDIRREMGEI